MGEATFYIILNLRTADSFEPIGKFSIGNKRAAAIALFKKLYGFSETDEKAILQLDLVETVNGLPINIQVMSCTLEELAENCRMITMEIFRLLNLKENG